MIIARRVSIVQKNGFRCNYSHVTSLKNVQVDDKQFFYIIGEKDDPSGCRMNSYDKYEVKDLELMQVDFYVPPV